MIKVPHLGVPFFTKSVEKKKRLKKLFASISMLKWKHFAQKIHLFSSKIDFLLSVQCPVKVLKGKRKQQLVENVQFQFL